MAERFWPMRRGCRVYDRFRPPDRRDHWGIDIGWEGGSAGMPVYAAQAGICTAGPAAGFGWWVLVDHPADAGGGLTVYGHVLPDVVTGQQVAAGELIARINPDPATNGHVPPHLHFEVHNYQWSPPGPARLDPLAWLQGCGYPDDAVSLPARPGADNDAVWAAILEQKIGPTS